MKSLLLSIFITFIMLTVSLSNLHAQPGPPGGGGPGGGDPPCWPPSTCDPVPINNELWLLLGAGLALGLYSFRKEKLKSISQ